MGAAPSFPSSVPCSASSQISSNFKAVEVIQGSLATFRLEEDFEHTHSKTIGTECKCSGLKPGSHLCDKHKRNHKDEFCDVHTVKQADENLAHASVVTSEKI